MLGEQILPMDAGMHNPDGSKTIVGFRSELDTAEEGESYTLACDATLLANARSAADRLSVAGALPLWPGRDGPPVVHGGVIGSSDTWTQHRPSIEQLHREHHTLCEEMESQAIASVCRTFDVPFLAVKDISNNELRDDTTDALIKVVDELGRRASIVVEGVIQQLAAERPRL